MGVICSSRERWWLSVACNSKNLKQRCYLGNTHTWENNIKMNVRERRLGKGEMYCSYSGCKPGLCFCQYDYEILYYCMVPWICIIAWYRAFILLHGTVHLYYCMVPCIYIIAWYRAFILLHGTVHLYYCMVPCIYIIAWYRAFILLHGTVHL